MFNLDLSIDNNNDSTEVEILDNIANNEEMIKKFNEKKG